METTLTFQELLSQLGACSDAREWNNNRTFEQALADCYRGDWLLWLHAKIRRDDLQSRTLAKGHCVNTIRHLMKDKRSFDAIDAAIAFGNGEITREQLDADAADATAAATAAAYAAAADDAVYDAAYAAAAAAADAADATAAATAAAYAAAADDAAARTNNKRLTADICRQYLKWE